MPALLGLLEGIDDGRGFKAWIVVEGGVRVVTDVARGLGADRLARLHDLGEVPAQRIPDSVLDVVLDLSLDLGPERQGDDIGDREEQGGQHRHLGGAEASMARCRDPAAHAIQADPGKEDESRDGWDPIPLEIPDVEKQDAVGDKQKHVRNRRQIARASKGRDRPDDRKRRDEEA